MSGLSPAPKRPDPSGVKICTPRASEDVVEFDTDQLCPAQVKALLKRTQQKAAANMKKTSLVLKAQENTPASAFKIMSSKFSRRRIEDDEHGQAAAGA